MIDKIKIGCYVYNVEITKDPIIIDNNSNYSGFIDFHQNKIKILDGLCPNLQNEILLHEIMHGIITYFELDLKNDDEEKIIECFAKGIYQIFRDNKNLLEVIS